MKNDCVFCGIVEGSVHEDELAMALDDDFLHIYPGVPEMPDREIREACVARIRRAIEG